jgi:hypothetical protein
MLPNVLSLDSTYVFTDERYFSAADKHRVLADWQRFLASGFKQSYFTPALYHTLHQSCAFLAHTNRERFWQHYFANEVAYLRALLAQFGGHHRSVEFGTTAWLDGPATEILVQPGDLVEKGQQLANLATWRTRQASPTQLPDPPTSRGAEEPGSGGETITPAPPPDPFALPRAAANLRLAQAEATRARPATECHRSGSGL